ncbi:hypothetical protein D9M72_288570 [compost metagenome]
MFSSHEKLKEPVAGKSAAVISALEPEQIEHPAHKGERVHGRPGTDRVGLNRRRKLRSRVPAPSNGLPDIAQTLTTITRFGSGMPSQHRSSAAAMLRLIGLVSTKPFACRGETTMPMP